MKFRIYVHFTGNVLYDIEADSLEEARSKAVDFFHEDGIEGNVYKTYGEEVTDDTFTS